MTEPVSPAPKYRKKPVVIEAMQFTEDNRAEVMAWCHSSGDSQSYHRSVLGFIVPTLEGQHIATLDDWIIKGVKGEFYPCKPDIFDATYEPATTPPSETATLKQNAAELPQVDEHADNGQQGQREARPSEDSIYAAEGFLDGVSRGLFASHSVAEIACRELLRIAKLKGTPVSAIGALESLCEARKVAWLDGFVDGMNCAIEDARPFSYSDRWWGMSITKRECDAAMSASADGTAKV